MMKTRKLVKFGLVALLVLICTALTATAQPPQIIWSRSYPYNHLQYLSTLICTEDGGYAMVGTFYENSGNRYDGYLRKTDSLGNELWFRRYGGFVDQGLGDIVQTPDGGYLLVGARDDTFMIGGWVVRTDRNGDTLWTRTFTESRYLTHEVQPLPDGTFAVAGVRRDSIGMYSPHLMVLDAHGDTLWTRHYPHFGRPLVSCYVTDLELTADGGYVLTGYLVPLQGIYDYALAMRVNSNGDTLWVRRYRAGYAAADGFSISAIASGGFLLGGSVFDSTYFATLAATMRLDDDGQVVWVRVFPYGIGGISASVTPRVEPDSDGCFLMTVTDSRIDAAVLAKLDAEGDTLWTMTMSRPDTFYGGVVAKADPRGGYIWGLYEVPPVGDPVEYPRLVRLSRDRLTVPSGRTEVPEGNWLGQIYPNPFNRTTRITYHIPRPGRVSLKVYNVSGREVATLSDEFLPAGEHATEFDASELPSGVYFCRLRAQGIMRTAKMLLLR